MFSLHTLVSSHSPKTCMNRPQVWIFECLSASALWQMGNLSSVLPMTSGLYVNTENRMYLQVWDWAHPKHSALWDMAMLLLHMHNTEHLLSYTTARQVEQTLFESVWKEKSWQTLVHRSENGRINSLTFSRFMKLFTERRSYIVPEGVEDIRLTILLVKQRNTDYLTLDHVALINQRPTKTFFFHVTGALVSPPSQFFMW